MKPEEEEKIQQRDSGFRLGCPECTEHFIDEKSRQRHLENIHNITWDDVGSGNIKDFDFKNGGTVFETLICDVCNEEKCSVFTTYPHSFVKCSDCNKEEN